MGFGKPSEAQFAMRPDAQQMALARGQDPMANSMQGPGGGAMFPSNSPTMQSGMDMASDGAPGMSRMGPQMPAGGLSGPRPQGANVNPGMRQALAMMLSKLGGMGR